MHTLIMRTDATFMTIWPASNTETAGMTFAVMAILGHFSKTLLLFFIPQILNFLYSVPQLFKVYPCPRHRMPDYDAVTDQLRPSTFTVKRKNAAYSQPRRSDQQGPTAAEDVMIERDNLTLINAVLRLLGPMHERTTTNVLLLLQVLCCVFGLLLRYYWSPQVYEAAALQPPAHSVGSTLGGA
jgi:UDP-N-acetylglucosamine--dolichyl-phosphate N-acetylglucosaminephosphotransferase